VGFQGIKWYMDKGTIRNIRKVGMYLVKRLCGLTLNEVAQRFGVRSYGVVWNQKNDRV